MMEVLILSGCILIGNAGFESVARWCTRLYKLNMSNCPLVGNKGLISVARNCSSLCCLYLDLCPFIGNESIVAFANGCKELDVVVISDCPLVGNTGVISLVSTRPKFDKLGLAGLRISDSVLEAIATRANHIFTLHLERIVGLSAAGYNVIAKLGQELTVLTIVSCVNFSVNSFMVPVQNKFSGLEELEIGDCDSITDEVLFELSTSSLLLRMLQLTCCSGFTSTGLITAVMNWWQVLIELELHKCCIGVALEHELDKPEIRELPECNENVFDPVEDQRMYPTLLMLHLKECTGVTDALLSRISHACTDIEEVNLESADLITDAGLLALLPSGPNHSMWGLNLKGCTGINGLTICDVVRDYGRGLSHLHLSNVRDSTVAMVALCCAEIWGLSFTGSAMITDFALDALVRTPHRKLELLDIRGCTGISRRAVEEFKSRFPSCKVITD